MKAFTLNVDDIKIRGEVFLPAGKPPYPTVIVCHGIPARPADFNDCGYPVFAEKLTAEGFAIVIFNFRGAGLSGGDFDIAGWIRDLQAVVDYVFDLPEVDKARVGLLGFSGGAATAIVVASQDKRIACVAACASPARYDIFTEQNAAGLISHFRSIGTIRDTDFPKSVPEWLENFKIEVPIKWVAGVAPASLLIVHGTSDNAVDVKQAYELYDAALEPKKLVIIDGAPHRLREDQQAMTAVTCWLKTQFMGNR